jgi:hypothetical protein
MLRRPVWRQATRVLGACLACILTVCCYYVGLALLVTFTGNDPDPAAVSADAGYFLAALALPTILGIYLVRVRHWRRSTAVMAAGFLVLAVHVLLLPVAIAAFSM